MKGICPYCEKVTDLRLVNSVEVIEIRGEKININVEYFVCNTCNQEFDDPKSEIDHLDLAFKEYRSIKGMMHPDEIRELRKQYGLTQKELSDVLGWGGVTLNRYENGSLQTEANDKMLKLVKQPHNLLSLIEAKPESIPEEKRASLIEKMRNLEVETCSFQALYEKTFSNCQADEFTGYHCINLDKFKNSVLFFSYPDPVWKTKLNKEIFYCDFKHHKEYGNPITGSRHVHIPHGPSPDKYDYHYVTLFELGDLSIDEEKIGNYVGDLLKSITKPDLSVFSESELKILATVKEYFKDFSAKEIRDFSHKERGYIETRQGSPISYLYSKDLQI
jgi:putative zinc finger/helix-turn-helix YgiT family protein